VRYDLRPRSFIEILGLSVRLLGDRFAAVCSIVAVCLGSLLLSGNLLPKTLPTLRILFELATSAIILSIAQLAIARVIADAYFGTATTIVDALRSANKACAASLGTFVLVFTTSASAYVLLVLPLAYFAVGFALVSPVAVIEQLHGRAMLKRSRALVRGHWWRTAAIIMVPSMFNSFVAVLVHLVVDGVYSFDSLLVATTYVIGHVFIDIAAVVLYFDLCSRSGDFPLDIVSQAGARNGARDTGLEPQGIA